MARTLDCAHVVHRSCNATACPVCDPDPASFGKWYVFAAYTLFGLWGHVDAKLMRRPRRAVMMASTLGLLYVAQIVRLPLLYLGLPDIENAVFYVVFVFVHTLWTSAEFLPHTVAPVACAGLWIQGAYTTGLSVPIAASVSSAAIDMGACFAATRFAAYNELALALCVFVVVARRVWTWPRMWDLLDPMKGFGACPASIFVFLCSFVSAFVVSHAYEPLIPFHPVFVVSTAFAPQTKDPFSRAFALAFASLAAPATVYALANGALQKITHTLDKDHPPWITTPK